MTGCAKQAPGRVPAWQTESPLHEKAGVAGASNRASPAHLSRRFANRRCLQETQPAPCRPKACSTGPLQAGGLLRGRVKIISTASGMKIAPRSSKSGEHDMLVAGGLGVLVVICLLLSMVQTPPDVGR